MKWASFRFNRDPVLVFMMSCIRNYNVYAFEATEPGSRNNETYYDRNFDVIGPSNENRYIYIYIYCTDFLSLCVFRSCTILQIKPVSTRSILVCDNRGIYRFNFKPNSKRAPFFQLFAVYLFILKYEFAKFTNLRKAI